MKARSFVFHFKPTDSSIYSNKNFGLFLNCHSLDKVQAYPYLLLNATQEMFSRYYIMHSLFRSHISLGQCFSMFTNHLCSSECRFYFSRSDVEPESVLCLKASSVVTRAAGGILSVVEISKNQSFLQWIVLHFTE